MSGTNTALLAVIVERYDYLVEHLRRRLRSADLARDALHDTYVHLSKAKELTAVGNPTGFLLRVAANIAADHQRAERRRASVAEIDVALDIADEAPDPARTAEAKSEFLLLEKAMAELPERRRAILLISLKEKIPAHEIAQRFGLSRRRVSTELQLAREHCARVLLNFPSK